VSSPPTPFSLPLQDFRFYCSRGISCSANGRVYPNPVDLYYRFFREILSSRPELRAFSPVQNPCGNTAPFQLWLPSNSAPNHRTPFVCHFGELYRAEVGSLYFSDCHLSNYSILADFYLNFLHTPHLINTILQLTTRYGCTLFCVMRCKPSCW